LCIALIKAESKQPNLGQPAIFGSIPFFARTMADKPTTPPPAYFLSLSLENVRSFGTKQTISFARADGRPAQWTIILGDNGVGKTTVLKGVAALRPRQEYIVDNVIRQYPVFNFDSSSRWFERSTQKTVRFSCVLGISTESSINSALSEQANVGFIAPGIDYLFEEEDNWEPFELSYSGVPEHYKGAICYGYGAGRTTGNSTLSETPETVDTCASLFDDRADLLNPEEWFLFADYQMARDKDPLTTQNFKLIKDALLKIMEEGEVTELEVIPPARSGRGSPRQGVRFKTPYGWVRLRDMSLGYQTLVVWLTDLADKLFVRYPDSKNPLEEPAIVLIDEIDLHLHPSWQRKLLKSLSEIFKNTQFIATAHSPLVVQAASDAEANVVLLKREDDQTIVYQGHDLPDVRRWRVEQILNSELFDDTPPLSPQTEADLARRNELLLKKRLTKAEKAELVQLEQVVAAQPVGTTGPERQAEDLLARLARNLGPEGLLK
jgi:nucleoside-triphosphatase THEP1